MDRTTPALVEASSILYKMAQIGNGFRAKESNAKLEKSFKIIDKQISALQSIALPTSQRLTLSTSTQLNYLLNRVTPLITSKDALSVSKISGVSNEEIAKKASGLAAAVKKYDEMTTIPHGTKIVAANILGWLALSVTSWFCTSVSTTPLTGRTTVTDNCYDAPYYLKALAIGGSVLSAIKVGFGYYKINKEERSLVAQEISKTARELYFLLDSKGKDEHEAYLAKHKAKIEEKSTKTAA